MDEIKPADDPRGHPVPHDGPTPHECGDWRIDVEWPALSPCPFCGGYVGEDDVERGPYGSHWVECDHCSAQGPDRDTKREAIEAWERRVTIAGVWDSVRDRIEARLVKAIDELFDGPKIDLATELTTIALGERRDP